MDDKINAITELFKEAGQTHHHAFIETDGADEDWPIWYADFLVDRLSELLDARLTRTQIVVLLVELDRQQKAIAPGVNWTRYYAKELVTRYSI